MNRHARINREKGTDDEHGNDHEHRKAQRDGTIDLKTETVPEESEGNKACQGDCESNVEEGNPGEEQESEKSG